MSSIPPQTPSAIPPTPEEQHASKRKHGEGDSEVLLRIYLKKRIQNQKDFYISRFREFETNSSFMVGMGAAIMGISAIVSTLGAGTASSNPRLAAMMALSTTLLPAFAALVAALRQLYQWDKQAALYRDAVLGLEEALLIMPDMDVFDKRTSPLVMPRLVKAAEDVFTSEINQWGQIAIGMQDKAGDDALNEKLRQLEFQDRITRSTGTIRGDIGGGGTRSGSSGLPLQSSTHDDDDGGVG